MFFFFEKEEEDNNYIEKEGTQHTRQHGRKVYIVVAIANRTNNNIRGVLDAVHLFCSLLGGYIVSI